MSARSITTSRVLTALALGCGAMASELVSRDLVLRVEDLPPQFTFHADGPGGTSEGEDRFGLLLGVAVGGRYSFAASGKNHGFLAGLEGAALVGDLKPAGGLQAGEARVMGGYGVAIDNRWTVDLCARVGAGYGRLELANEPAFGRLALSGPLFSWSTEIGLHWQASADWRLAFAAGWRQTRYALRGGGVDLNLDSAGVTWVLGLEYALSQRPGALE